MAQVLEDTIHSTRGCQGKALNDSNDFMQRAQMVCKFKDTFNNRTNTTSCQWTGSHVARSIVTLRLMGYNPDNFQWNFKEFIH